MKTSSEKRISLPKFSISIEITKESPKNKEETLSQHPSCLKFLKKGSSFQTMNKVNQIFLFQFLMRIIKNLVKVLEEIAINPNYK